MPGQPVPVAAPRLRRRDDAESCDICNAPVPDDHRHVVDLDHRGLLCACQGCYLLFTPDGAGGRRYRAVPDRYLAVTPPALADIPVGIVFYFVNSALDRVVAFYPSTAGATESLLPLDESEAFAQLTPDVEAVLVRDGAAYIVPIDACYELVGRLRSEGTGALDPFFRQLEARAR